jgi:uncharacterized protein YbaP (TraB family)
MLAVGNRNRATAVTISPRRRPGFRTAILCVLAGLFQFIFCSIPAVAQEKSFLWKVSNDKHSIYLLGSIHYLKQEHYPLRKPILDALDHSKRLVLEIDLNSTKPQAAQRATMEKAVYRDGTTLQQNIDADTYQLVGERAVQLGIDMQVMSPMKPWFVALALMAIKLDKLGLNHNFGVDRYLADRAKQSGKTTSGLETLEFQIGLLDQLSRRDQDLMLKEMVRELDLLDHNINLIVQAWLTGDRESLESSLLEGMREYPDLHQKIIVDRNRRWLAQIEKLLEQGDGAMVVVGAAHLVGKDGVVEMLKARGYKLEQQ